MKAIIVFLLLALVSGVCCKPRIRHLEDNNQPSSSSSSSLSEEEEINLNNRLRQAQPQLDTPKNEEYIRAVDIFKSKIVDRLHSSTVLLKDPDMKTRLLGIAVEKFKSCESPNVAHHPCLGIATGQVMSLIASYEKTQMEQSLDSEK